jgi:orotidine-5'-phosphate decarboxylase
MKANERIILALDVPGYDEAMDVVRTFEDHIDIFKIGLELFTSAGPRIVEDINAMGKKIFLDLKFHDIPNTVSKSALAVAKLGVFMFNVHTSGGFEMMKQTADTLAKYSIENNVPRPKLIGVTILTSIDKKTLRDDIGVKADMPDQVIHLAALAKNAGLDGVVASPEDAADLRARFGKDFLIVTPGIRPSWSAMDDQKRASTPQSALKNGASYLVIGRAITSAPDPLDALKKIEDEINGV